MSMPALLFPRNRGPRPQERGASPCGRPAACSPGALSSLWPCRQRSSAGRPTCGTSPPGITAWRRKSITIGPISSPATAARFATKASRMPSPVSATGPLMNLLKGPTTASLIRRALAEASWDDADGSALGPRGTPGDSRACGARACGCGRGAGPMRRPGVAGICVRTGVRRDVRRVAGRPRALFHALCSRHPVRRSVDIRTPVSPIGPAFRRDTRGSCASHTIWPSITPGASAFWASAPRSGSSPPARLCWLTRHARGRKLVLLVRPL